MLKIEDFADKYTSDWFLSLDLSSISKCQRSGVRNVSAF